MAFRAVIFDLFDTLVDLRYEQLPWEEYDGRRIPPTFRALHAAVADRAEVDFDTFLEVSTAVDRDFRATRHDLDLELPTEERFAAVVERLGLCAPELPGVMTDIHMGVLRAYTEVPAHHAEILAGLRRRVRVGLCSNFSHSETALGILEESGLGRHIDAVVISDALGVRKPRGEIFAAALEDLDVAPGEALHVGDSLRADVGGAARAGISSAWITRRVRDAEARLQEHAGPRPDFIVRDLSEVASLLDRSGS